MKLLADESIDRQIVEHLRLDGHHVSYIAEMEPGIPDDAVLNLANDEEALLITADKDFGELVSDSVALHLVSFLSDWQDCHQRTSPKSSLPPSMSMPQNYQAPLR